MYETIKSKYDFSSWGKRLEEESIVLTNFIPWQKDCLEWQRSSKELFTGTDELRLTRTIWDNPEDEDSRVLIDVYETSSFAQAKECLIELLASNQLEERLPEGPDDLGEVSFMHIEGIPPTVLWLRGNLCLSVDSFGKKDVDVLTWAYRLDSRIMDKPKVDRLILSLTSQKDEVNLEEEVKIDFSLPWQLCEDGYYKFFAAGGELFFRGQELYFCAQRKGEAVIEAFAVEAGREPYRGRLILEVVSTP